MELFSAVSASTIQREQWRFLVHDELSLLWSVPCLIHCFSIYLTLKRTSQILGTVQFFPEVLRHSKKQCFENTNIPTMNYVAKSRETRMHCDRAPCHFLFPQSLSVQGFWCLVLGNHGCTWLSQFPVRGLRTAFVLYHLIEFLVRRSNDQFRIILVHPRVSGTGSTFNF